MKTAQTIQNELQYEAERIFLTKANKFVKIYSVQSIISLSYEQAKATISKHFFGVCACFFLVNNREITNSCLVAAPKMRMITLYVLHFHLAENCSRSVKLICV